MQIKELLNAANEELEDEKIEDAKEVLKSRIIEIVKTEKMLAKLKAKYQDLLECSIDDVVDEIENNNIRF